MSCCRGCGMPPVYPVTRKAAAHEWEDSESQPRPRVPPGRGVTGGPGRARLRGARHKRVRGEGRLPAETAGLPREEDSTCAQEEATAGPRRSSAPAEGGAHPPLGGGGLDQGGVRVRSGRGPGVGVGSGRLPHHPLNDSSRTPPSQGLVLHAGEKTLQGHARSDSIFIGESTPSRAS